MRQRTSAFNNRLAGRRVAITRPRAQAAPLVERLLTLGALSSVYPAIAIAPAADPAALVDAARSLHRYAWLVFTSGHGVAAFVDAGIDIDRTWRGRIAAIGPATTAA